MRKNILRVLPILLIVSLVLVACGGQEEAANPMNYISAEDLQTALEENPDDYIILDVRQAEDYEEDHVDGAFLADMHEANKEGDLESGQANMKAALKEATGSEEGSDQKYVLFCYSGKSYAQAGTDALIDIGVPADQILTLEGGYEAWNE